MRRTLLTRNVSVGPSAFAVIVTLCFLVAVVEGVDLQVLSAIGPLVRGPLHLDHEQLGLIFSASLVGLGMWQTGLAARRSSFCPPLP